MSLTFVLTRRLIETFATDITGAITGRRSLVLAPHPDDEVLGCGGVIARKTQAGEHVTIVFLTSGDRGFSRQPPDAAAVREAEAREATAVLGIPSEDVVFMRIADGELWRNADRAAADIKAVIERERIDDIYVSYRRDYHADHQAAWRITTACLRPGMRLYEYPIWYGPWLWPRLGWRARMAALTHLADTLHSARVDITPVIEVKRRALAAYRSQVAGFRDRGRWGVAFIDNFLKRDELFFVTGKGPWNG